MSIVLSSCLLIIFSMVLISIINSPILNPQIKQKIKREPINYVFVNPKPKQELEHKPELEHKSMLVNPITYEQSIKLNSDYKYTDDNLFSFTPGTQIVIPIGQSGSMMSTNIQKSYKFQKF